MSACFASANAASVLFCRAISGEILLSDMIKAVPNTRVSTSNMMSNAAPLLVRGYDASPCCPLLIGLRKG